MNAQTVARKRDKEKAPKTPESETMRRMVAAKRAAVNVWVNLDLKGSRPRCVICGVEIKKIDVQEGLAQYVMDTRGQHTFVCPACYAKGDL